jgi:DNA-binding transcriptional LysR family regulator
MLDIDLLKTFVAICESGSFKAASDVVGRTQSAVSLQIKKLEDQLGQPLLTRCAPNVAPTERGEVLLSHARRILGAHESALGALGGRAEESRHVVLGIAPDYGQVLLPRVLAVLGQERPDTTVEVVCDTAAEIAASVLDGRVDIAFVADGQGQVAHRERCIWASGGDAHLRDPMPLALVPRDSCLYRQWATDRLDAIGRRYRILYTSIWLGGLQAIVRGGRAVTVISESALIDGMIEVGEAEGFPSLPEIQVRVERCRAKASSDLRVLERMLSERLAV